MKRISHSLKFIIILAAVLIFSLVPGVGRINARADMATDYLSIKVGYSGMKLRDYVEVGKYHWSELYENLKLYSEAYSYYSDGVGKKFNAIVDCANGFRVKDILSYANIYYGDIYNLKFYVEDHQGIQASFDRDSLFATRYYFEDFNYNSRYYDENGKLVTDIDNCWNYCKKVEPMLALEDDWETFTEEYEHSFTNFENMKASTRFRLLYGQTSPTESETSSSAKYVSCVYVTLYGKPTYGKTSKLNGKYGAHTVEMTVKSDNESIRNALSDLLKLSSTNEDVLVIRGYTVTQDDFYSDIAHVTVDYEIVGEGTASITASVAGVDVEEGSEGGSAPTINNEGVNKSDASGGSSKKDSSSDKNKDRDSSNKKEDSDKSDQQDGDTSDSNSSGESTDDQGLSTGEDGENSSLDAANAEDIEVADTSKLDSVDTVAAGNTGAYALSGDAAKELTDSLAQVQEELPADQDITGIEVEDTTEEDEDEARLMLICVGLGAIGLVVLGTIFGSLFFKAKRDPEKYKRLAKLFRTGKM